MYGRGIFYEFIYLEIRVRTQRARQPIVTGSGPQSDDDLKKYFCLLILAFFIFLFSIFRWLLFIHYIVDLLVAH